VQEARKKFKEFLENFVDDVSAAGDRVSGELGLNSAQPYYMARLDEVRNLFVRPQL